VRRYQTEIAVPPDRYVCLQLPSDFPEGLATVTVHFHESPYPTAREPSDEGEFDREDIEWWEEFESESESSEFEED
jgi:hypothetical protein